MRGLEASLVNVVERESLCGVGAVLIHLDDEPAVLVPPGCHDVGLGEGHVCARGRRPQAAISAISLLRGPAPWQPPARPARCPSKHLRHRETRSVTVGHFLCSQVLHGTGGEGGGMETDCSKYTNFSSQQPGERALLGVGSTECK